VSVPSQAILAVEALDPPADGEVSKAAERLRDLAIAELRVGRLRGPDTRD
jgi:hypothetical protein